MSAPILCAARAWRQRGAAAVELALILSVTTLLMLPALALCVFTFYQYNVVKLATDDAAKYMASIPRVAFMTGPQRAAARSIAFQLVEDAKTGAGFTAVTWVDTPDLTCSGLVPACNAVVPEWVRFEVSVELDLMGFDMLDMVIPESSVLTRKILYSPRATAPYVN